MASIKRRSHNFLKWLERLEWLSHPAVQKDQKAPLSLNQHSWIDEEEDAELISSSELRKVETKWGAFYVTADGNHAVLSKDTAIDKLLERARHAVGIEDQREIEGLPTDENFRISIAGMPFGPTVAEYRSVLQAGSEAEQRQAALMLIQKDADRSRTATSEFIKEGSSNPRIAVPHLTA